MSRKTKNMIKFIAILMVIMSVFMETGHVKFFSLEVYRFWLVVIAFGLSLISSR